MPIKQVTPSSYQSDVAVDEHGVWGRMPTLADAEDRVPDREDHVVELVLHALSEISSQTVEELREWVKGSHPDLTARELRNLLNSRQDLFTQRRGWWQLRSKQQTAAPTPIPSERSANRSEETRPVRTARIAPPSEPPIGPSAVEREMRDHLRGRRMVAEIGLDALTFERVRDSLEQILDAGFRPNQVVVQYPALLTCYLVGHGMYHYDGGEFWTTLDLPQLAGQTWRQVFEDSIRGLKIETFEDMVYGDNAWRYVAPILAHGGIPRSSLDRYFGLIHRFLRQAGTATEMLALWRTRKSPFVGIGKPVQRFLLYGGDLAVDLVDRTIDMFREYARSGVVSKPVDLGLPAYVVNEFRKFVQREHVSGESIAKRQTGPKAVIQLDPWGGSGPTLTLPILNAAEDVWAWRLQGDGQFERFPVSRFMEREVPLRAARGWTVSLIDGLETKSEVAFEGLGELSALFFDPKDGRLISPAGGLRLERAWVLLPGDAKIEAVAADGSQAPIGITEELPELGQAWSGYRQMEVSLHGLRAVAIRADDQKPWSRLVVRSVSERPRLEGEPLPHTRSDGLTVYSDLPALRVPPGDWTIRSVIDGTPQPIRTAEVPTETTLDLELPGGVHEVELSVRGPLGADLRTRFVVCPGLSITRPERVLMPGDRASSVTTAGPSLSINHQGFGIPVTLEIPDAEDEVRCAVADGSGQERQISVRVAKVLWALACSNHESLTFSNRATHVVEDELTGREPTSLVVRTGRSDLPLRLALTSGSKVLQESDRGTSKGEEGRWVFDLGRFSDAVRDCESSQLAFELQVGQLPVTAAHVRRSLEISDLKASVKLDGGYATVDLAFRQERQLTGRVARLWPLMRPWDGPIEEPIPDDEAGHVTIGGHGRVAPGSYLAEIAVDSGWTSPTRPTGESASTALVQVGDFNAVLLRFSTEPAEDPFDRLEQAIATGFMAQPFGNHEWEKAGTAAADSAAQMAAGLVPSFGVETKSFSSLRWLLGKHPLQTAIALVDCAESGRVTSRSALSLSVEMVWALRRNDAVETPPAISRALWAVSPAIAAALELADAKDVERSARLFEFTGWNPQESEPIPTGEPVTQVYLGMGADQMATFRSHLDLIPDQILGIDELVAAHLEWLLAEKLHPGLAQRWWADHKGLERHPLDLWPVAVEHLGSRRPPTGTEQWAAIPRITLLAAFMVILDVPAFPEAARALHEAATFAPRLVMRDLVLAQVLTVLSTIDSLHGGTT